MKARRRVLVIDDSQIVIAAVREALDEAGFSVVAVTDTALFHTAKVSDVDLILMDVNMPEVFGDDVAEYFREELGIEVPIYLFSGIGEAELKERAKAAGVAGYISKQQGLDAMVERVVQIAASL